MDKQEKKKVKEERRQNIADFKKARKAKKKSKRLPPSVRNFEKFYYKFKIAGFKLVNFRCKKGQIVFLGDSLTEFCKLDRFYKEVKRKNKLKLYNRGIAGDTTDGVLDRMNISALNLEPKNLVLFIGINDVFATIDNKLIIENFKKIVSILKEQLTSTKVLVCSLTPICQTSVNKEYIDLDYTINSVIEINKEYEKIAKEKGFDFVDLFSEVKDEKNYLRKDLTIDGIHFNKTTYKIISKKIIPFLIKK